jgi:hypothetical protein
LGIESSVQTVVNAVQPLSATKRLLFAKAVAGHMRDLGDGSNLFKGSKKKRGSCFCYASVPQERNSVTGKKQEDGITLA